MTQWTSLGLLACLGLVACAPPAVKNFQIDLFTRSDSGARLGNVEIWHGGQLLGTTTEEGQLSAEVVAADDSDFRVRFVCPEGYTAARDRAEVSLRRVSRSTAFRLVLECKPNTRNAVIVVRANVGNLPLLHDGEPVGRTDRNGIAHVALDIAEGEAFEVTLDTSFNPDLRPSHPKYAFVMPAHAEAFAVTEDFSLWTPPAPPPAPKVEKPKKKRKPKKKAAVAPEPKPRGPTQIFSNTKSQWGEVK